MAKRTESQIIGDIAINKIKSSLIPDSWIINDQSNDYGLDLNVEVCVEGYASGKFFFIQSKGTRQSSSYGYISYEMKVERLLDYSQILIPILLIYYSASDDVFWGLWVNDVYNQLTEEQKSQTYYSIKFDQINIVNKNYLEHYAKNIQNDLPYRFDFRTNTASCIQLHQQLFKLLDSQCEGKFSCNNRLSYNKIFLEYKTTSKGISISITDGAYKIDIMPMQVEAAFLWYPKIDFEEAPQIAQILVTIIGLMHYGKGNKTIDSILCSDEILDKILPLVPSHCWIDWVYNTSLANSNTIEKIFRKALAGYPEVREYFLFALFVRGELDQSAGVLRKKLMSLMVEKVDSPEEKGHTCYNLANYMRQTNLYEAGILYCKAAHFSPSYKETYYWWKEIAGVLFVTGHYYLSEAFYKKSLSLLKNNPQIECEILLLIADVCLYRGNIKEAQKCIAKYIDNYNECGETIPMKVLLLSKSYDLYDTKLLKKDKIYKSGTEWFNAGISSQCNGDFTEAMEDFLIAWAYNVNDSEALINAFVMSINAGNIKMGCFILVVIKSTFEHKELNAFIKEITEWNLPEEAKELLLQDIVAENKNID